MTEAAETAARRTALMVAAALVGITTYNADGNRSSLSSWGGEGGHDDDDGGQKRGQGDGEATTRQRQGDGEATTRK